MPEGVLSFIYRDAQGNITFREVFDISESDRYIQGICLKARALRTFRRDRILETTNADSDIEAKLEYYRSQFPEPEEIYHHSKSRSNKDHKPEICFTGFKKDEKQQLIEMAESSSFFVRTAVTSNLEFLCCGSTAGPKKIERARAQGVLAISKSQFETLVETGEMPEEE